MEAQVEKQQTPENQENDFIDAIVGTTVSSLIFFGIFIAATVVSLLM